MPPDSTPSPTAVPCDDAVGHQFVIKIEPLNLDEAGAAAVVGVSQANWRKLVASGRAPQSIRLGRRCLWPVKQLREWVDSGMQPISQWQANRWLKSKEKELSHITERAAG